MEKQELKDKTGRKLGEIRIESGLEVLYDRTGRKLGSFDPKNKTTKDKSGRTIGKGNLLVTLLVTANL